MRRIVLVLLLLLPVVCVLAQGNTAPKTVQGVVTSAEDGLPLPQLAIRIKGLNTGVVTDTQGYYKISVPNNETTLIFEYVGMETQEILVGDRSEINVVMNVALEEIDQVMVMGYTQRTKNQLTGSSVQLKNEELTRRPGLQVAEGLAGRVPGFVATMSSSTPGALQNVRIRGAGSIVGGSTDPLYVVDGVPIAYEKSNRGLTSSTLSSLASLNSSDIESVTVLKDASATAAYGARGANGVVVIKTKSGRAGETKFNFTGRYGFSQRLPNLGFMTPLQQLRLIAEGDRNAEFLKALQANPGLYNEYLKGNLSGASLDAVRAIWNSLPTLESYEKELLNGGKLITLPTGEKIREWPEIKTWDSLGRPTYNFADAYWRRFVHMTEAQLSASGGSDSHTFYTSVGANYSQNPIEGADFKRINGSLNMDRKLTSWLKFETNNQLSYTRQDGVFNEQLGSSGNPIAGPYYVPQFHPIYDKDGKPNLRLKNALNYLYIKDHDDNYNALTHLSTNNTLSADIWEGLKFKTRFAVDIVGYDAKTYANRTHSEQYFFGGQLDQIKQTTYNLVTQNSLSYDFSIADTHRFSLLALQEYQKNFVNYLFGSAQNSASDKLPLGSLSKNKRADGFNSNWANAAYLGLLNYDYDSRYVVDLSYRREGSSRFSRQNRFGNFGSVGLAWNMHAESFFEPALKVINRLRLRGSWGVSGNSEIGENKYRSTLEYYGQYNGNPAGDVFNLQNPNLTWEKNATLDVGIEFGLWNERITGAVTYFKKDAYDMLQIVPISGTTGHKVITLNAGEMENKGVELQFDFGILRGADYSLSLGLNFATLSNKVNKMYRDPKTGKPFPIEEQLTKTDEGHLLNEWYLYPWAGVDPTTGLPQWYTDETRTKVTTNPTETRRVYTGYSAIPTRTGGINIHADWRGIYLDMSATYIGGHKIMNQHLSEFYNDNAQHIRHATGVEGMYGKTWQGIGDKSEYPILTTLHSHLGDLSRASDQFLRMGDFIRLRDITLGYNFAKNILKKMHFAGSIQIYAQVTNLLTYKFDKKLNYDPEVPENGLWEFVNPAMRTVSFGCNVNF